MQSIRVRLQAIDFRVGILLRMQYLFLNYEDEISTIFMDMAHKYDQNISLSELCLEVQDQKFRVQNYIIIIIIYI